MGLFTVYVLIFFFFVLRNIFGWCDICSCDELTRSLSVGVPQRSTRKPLPAAKEALLRDALVARKVIPVKCTTPS